MYVEVVYNQQRAENPEASNNEGKLRMLKGKPSKLTKTIEYDPNGANDEIEEEIVKISLTAYSIVLFVGILYPALYESFQICKKGFNEYFSNPSNCIDVVYIWGSVAMQVIHIIYSPYTWFSKLLLVIVLLLAIRRTFKFLRIF